MSEPVPVAQHGELVPYKGLSGFSLGGSHVGDTHSEAKRLATGAHEYTEGCKDIDWCLVTLACGPHADGLDSYICSCALGYHSVSASNGETCVEVNECDAWREAAAYSPATCIDRVNGFPCTCPSGYLTVNHDADKERCEREVCEVRSSFQVCHSQHHIEDSFRGCRGVHL